jgi:hypothetical protein
MLRVCKKGKIVFIGDIYNKRLKLIFERYFKNKNISFFMLAKIKIKFLLKKILSSIAKYDFFENQYLYLDPNFFFENFSSRAYIIPKLITSQKPMIFKTFRYDIILIKK